MDTGFGGESCLFSFLFVLMHHHSSSDMSISTGCMFLICGSQFMNLMSSLTAGYGLIQWAQFIGLFVGMVASGYVIHNQRETLKWKKRGGTATVDKKQNESLKELKETIALLTEKIEKLKENG